MRRQDAREVAAVKGHQGSLPKLHTPLFSQSPSSIRSLQSPSPNLPGLLFSSSFPEGLPVSSPASLQSPTPQSRRLERSRTICLTCSLGRREASGYFFFVSGPGQLGASRAKPPALDLSESLPEGRTLVNQDSGQPALGYSGGPVPCSLGADTY